MDYKEIQFEFIENENVGLNKEIYQRVNYILHKNIYSSYIENGM